MLSSCPLQTSEPLRGQGTLNILLFQVLENSSGELKVTDGMEEMEIAAAEEQGQDIIMCSPQKETCTRNNFARSGEPEIHPTGADLKAAYVVFMVLLGPYVYSKVGW